MAFFRGTFKSNVLNMTTHLNVILPELGVRPERTLILLHGLSGAADDWVRKTSIERYARDYNLAVFMPEVQRSWYIDMKYGRKYFTYVAEELPQLIAGSFNVPTDPEHLYIGGLSMGGYGSTKCVLTHPERYAGLMALSSRFSLVNKLKSIENNPDQQNEWRAILGEDLVLRDCDNLDVLLEDMAQKPQHVRIYVACGTEDSLYGENVRMRDMMRERGLEIEYEEWSGIHDWKFWDAAIQRGLKYVMGD